MNKPGMYLDIKNLFSNAFPTYAEKHFLSSELLNSLCIGWEKKWTGASFKYAAMLNAQENK